MAFDTERIRKYIPKGDGYNSEFAHDLEAAAQEIESLARGNDRYETARLLNPRAWQEAWQLNVSSGKPFDEIIDELKPFLRHNAVYTHK